MTAARSPAAESGKNLELAELASYSSSTRDILDLLRPYLGKLVLLALAAVFLSFLTGTTQVALTPLLEIVLGSGAPVVDASLTTFDLNELGRSILAIVARLTGVTDRWPLLLITSSIYLVLALVGQAAAFGTRIWALRIRLNIARDLEHRLFGHILRLPLSFLNRHQTGWLQSRMISDVNASLKSINTLVIDGLSSSLLSLFYVYLLFVTSFRLTIVVGLAGLAQLLLSRGLTDLAKSRTRISFEAGAQLLAFVQERFTVAREIKAFGGEDHEHTGFWEMVSHQIRAAYKQVALEEVEKPIRWSINRTVIIVVMLFGAWELFNGRLTTAGFLLFMFIAQSLIGPLAALAAAYLQVEVIKASLEGVSYILAQREETGGSRPLPAEGFRHALVFENVSFAYEELPVLHDISLTIKKGEMVALVGRSGAGKTTLVDLLLRFFEPDSGRITLDGVPVSEFDLYEYRRMFGVVSQDGALFNDTVLKNIAYARPDLPHEAVEQAAAIANAQDFIMADLSDGYATVLGERGVRLSGGQRQRIAIARAVAHQPEILILDEATSALDSESERLVQDAIARVVAGSTSIVIAHRLSTIRMADKIVVMKEGRIVEVGTHQDLLERSGEYSYLHDLQFQVEDTP
jgi:subfamily B ATP-binding cassette protein MsbA